MDVVLGITLAGSFVGGAVLGAKGARSLATRVFDRRIERWLAYRDAADGPYVHLTRGTPAAPSRLGAAARTSAPVAFDPIATARTFS
jgi:hypothetical protein